MLSLCVVALGLIAWFKMPLQFLPKIDDPVIGCYIPYPGGSPQQVEQQITIPVEGEFRTIPGLHRMWTYSDSNGCRIKMLFNLDVDMSLATAEIRDRMERLKLKLPDEANHMLLERFSSGSLPVIAFGLFREGAQEDFTHLIRNVVDPRVSRIDGVADVQVHSPIPEKQVLIEFDQDRLKSLNIGLAQIIANLRESSLNVSVGEVADGGTRYYVRAMSEYRRLEDIADMVVTPNGLRLDEVADVHYGSRGLDVHTNYKGDQTSGSVHVSLDGLGGVIVFVIKESEANTVATCEAAKAELEKIIQEPDFKGAKLKIFFDQSDLIGRALKNLFKEGIYGGIMAICILFVFLHRSGPTLIVALAIPTSMVVALVFMYFYGMSLNIVSMVSLIIAVGMLVDNAIVVVENIIRHRQLGRSTADSSLKGAGEVGLAILASTATTAVVFVPMFFLETGRMSVLTEELGLPMIVALIGSLVIALTLTPLAMSWFPERPGPGPMQRLEQSLETRSKFFARLTGRLRTMHPIIAIVELYAKCLSFALNRRVETLFIVLVLAAFTYAIPYQHVGMREMPKLDTRELNIEVDLEQNFDMPMARAFFQSIENRIEVLRDELAIKNILSFHENSGGVVHIYLYTEDDGPIGVNPPYDTEEALAVLRTILPAKEPGADLRLFIADTGDRDGESGVTVRLRGDDTGLLAEYAGRFKTLLESLDDLYDVHTSLENSKQEMRILIDEPKANEAGTSPMAVAQTVDAALRGARMPYMKQGGREIEVWVQFREEDRQSRANLDNVMVMGMTGKLVPLSQLVDYQRAGSPTRIRRVNGKNVVMFDAKTDNPSLSGVAQEIEGAASIFELPPGYDIELGEDFLDLARNIFNFASMLSMAIILIYLVMSALFESFLLPLSILTTVPLALAGSIWMLFFTGSQFDTVTLIGNILMVGIIVNNGIVIIDRINGLRAEEPDRVTAMVRAGRERFRPVMMTALTTILGLVPVAMQKTGGAATFAGLGRSLIGGLVVGTLLTLIVVPLFYSLLDDFQRWCVDYLGIFTRFRKKAPASQAAGFGGDGNSV